MIRFYALLPLFLSIFLLSCSPDEPQTNENRVIVAMLDDLEITETSFQRSYLPVLLYGDKFDSEENRADMVNYLIGQKLLAQKGREAHLDTIALIKQLGERSEGRALSRQIYKKWVKDNVPTPSEAELREGFRRGQKGIFVRHLFADSEADIQEYSRRLRNHEESFYTLAQNVFSDTTLSKNGGALGWITFGDLDETLEDTVYNMKAGQISQPVKSQYGWHILTVEDTQEEVFITETDYLENRDLIYNKILERRENVLGKQVLNDFMSQYPIEFNRDITRQVWPIVVAHLNPDDSKPGQSVEFSKLLSSLEVYLDERLLSVDREDWTVSDILKRMPELDRSLLYGNLYVAASNIIRNEMLTREARSLGLDKHPDVLEEVQDSQDQIIADTYVSLIADTLNFDKLTQRNFFQKNKLTRYHAPDSLLVELFEFPDSLAAVKGLSRLRNKSVSTDPGREQIWIGATEHKSRLYMLTRSIAVGTTSGPVYYQSKWVLVKLMDRKRLPLEFEAIQTRVLADMERERFNTTRSILLDMFRPEHNISINFELLNH